MQSFVTTRHFSADWAAIKGYCISTNDFLYCTIHIWGVFLHQTCFYLTRIWPPDTACAVQWLTQKQQTVSQQPQLERSSFELTKYPGVVYSTSPLQSVETE